MSSQDSDPPDAAASEELASQALAAREVRRERQAEEAAALAAEQARIEDEAKQLADERAKLEEARRERDSTREHLTYEAMRMEAERARMEELEEKAAVLLAERARLAQEREALITRQKLELERIDRRLEEIDRAARAREGRPPVFVSDGGPKRKARLRLSASVLVDHDGHAEILSLLNVSLTGGLISTAGTQLGRLRLGSLLFVTLMATDDIEQQVDVSARVVRHDGDATALDWSADEVSAHGVARLLDALAS